MYVLSNYILGKIQEHRPGIISKLALSLICSENTINRLVRINELNGDLTKAAATDVLHEEFGMPIEQILQKTTAANSSTHKEEHVVSTT